MCLVSYGSKWSLQGRIWEIALAIAVLNSIHLSSTFGKVSVVAACLCAVLKPVLKWLLNFFLCDLSRGTN